MQDWESHLQISRPDLEMALKVVDQAWNHSTEELVRAEIPPSLHHLSKDQWEIICDLLAEMQYQLNWAQVH
tara:strand:- start:299 stop:511 length:213 start_codon:yes stop_codon:yes gene_type:complete